MMRGRIPTWLSLILAIALSLCVCAPAVAQEESPADIATARELFREGLKLSKDEKWAEARVKLEQSLALKQTALTYYTLAVADKNSGHLVAALEHFRGFLAQPVTDKTEGFVEPAKSAVAELEKRVANVTIRVSPKDIPGLSIKVGEDDVPLSALGRKRLIDPGEHQVFAEADGYRSATEKVVTTEGGLAEVNLVLEPLPDVVGPPPDKPFPVLAVALIGAGAGVGIAGLVLGIVGAGEAEEAPTRDGPEADAALTKTIAGDVMMGVGGAAAIVGVVLLVLHVTDDEPTAPTAARGPVFAPWLDGSTVGLQVLF